MPSSVKLGAESLLKCRRIDSTSLWSLDSPARYRRRFFQSDFRLISITYRSAVERPNR
jgi:hypothetical protein